jgi:hypothetical protein
MKILLDCQIINEDTLVGLELQTLTPFRFHFHKLWLNNSIRQILSPSNSFDLNLILNLTHSDVNSSNKQSTIYYVCLILFIDLVVCLIVEYYASTSHGYTHGNQRK